MHIPVLLNEVIDCLNIKKDGIYVDCTLGGGGHSEQILRNISSKGKLIAIDQDAICLEIAHRRLSNYKNIIFVHNNFCYLRKILNKNKIIKCSGIIFDLGVCSFQLDIKERGFSFNSDVPLDMRMNTTSSITAKSLINSLSSSELERIISKYGEERWAKRIAKFIVKERKYSPIVTTRQLVNIIAKAIPLAARPKNIHFATRTFQALRIAVNDELEALKKGLSVAIDVLEKGGRLCVISFHSLEDRIVKETFRDLSKKCTCPSDFPVCVCDGKNILKVVTKKPIIPSEGEILKNPRARSAKLRIAEKI